MPRPIIVVDNDLNLVAELKRCHGKCFPDQKVIGPPDLLLDLPGVRENIEGASAIVLDLNIYGSASYSQALLKRLRHELSKSDTLAIVWSKYLLETIVFETTGVYRIDSTMQGSQVIEKKNLESSEDYKQIIRPLRVIYGGTRAFVSKACARPVDLLLHVFSRLGVVSCEPSYSRPSAASEDCHE